MSSHHLEHDQRCRNRLQMKDSMLAVIRGNLDGLIARVEDMNICGLGCHIKSGEKIAPRSIVLDLISKQNRIILRSLPAYIVFNTETTLPEKDTKLVWRRYGIRFGNISTLQKRQLNLIIKKYAISV